MSGPRRTPNRHLAGGARARRYGKQPLLIVAVFALATIVVGAMVLAYAAGYKEGALTRHSKWKAHAASLIGLSAAVPAQALPVPPTTIGIDLTGLKPHLQSRAFANLALGAYKLAQKGSKWQPYPEDQLDQNGELKTIPADASAIVPLTPPAAVSGGADIRCTYQGTAKIEVKLGPTNISVKPHLITFHWDPAVSRSAALVIRSMEQGDPIRRLDCREASIPADARFDPAFVKWLHGFKVLRFMDWQSVNNNAPVSWATRHTPLSRDITSGDGTSIEDMVALARLTGADAWFNMPWNTDDEYITNFARYVHDNLPARQKVYVELANEVWNWNFAVAKQASREGAEEKLSSDPLEAQQYRYAERSAHVLDLWARVFADNPQRLVRVVSTQYAVPDRAELVLGFRDTAKHVDALATAPYFRFNAKKQAVANADEALKLLDDSVDQALAKVLQSKQIAAKYGKRYVAYEAGQGLIMRDVDLQKKIQRDPRMHDIYTHFIEGWRKQIGDTLMLFCTVYPISQYGAWGLVEYSGQPESEAPKLRAVREQLAK